MSATYSTARLSVVITVIVLTVRGQVLAQPQLWLGNDHLISTVLNTTTDGTVLRTLAQGNNTGVAVDLATNTLFLSARTGAIQTRDLTSLTVTGSIPSPGSSSVYEDLAWDGTNLYRADFTGDRVFRVNRATGAETLFVSGFDGPVGVAYDSSDNTFWMSSFNSAQLRHYDAAGVQIGASVTLALGSGFRAGGLGHDPRDNTLWLGSDERVFHISTQGLILGSFNTPEFGTGAGDRFVDGVEFVVPEPAATCAAAGVAVALRLARKRGAAPRRRLLRSN